MKQNKNLIKAARVMQGLTQTQLGKKIGKNQSWVSAVENGGLGEANLVDVLRLCKVLGISLNEAAEIVSI